MLVGLLRDPQVAFPVDKVWVREQLRGKRDEAIVKR
jgi:hypothetical protein